jgi:hypothetical protein
MLRYRVPASDIDRLLLTRRYWAIQGAPDGGSAGVVNTEIDDREAALHETVNWLTDTQAKWQRSPGRLVVADTSVYCQHPDRLTDINYASAIGQGRIPIRLMVPILVLDELEGLKQSNKRQTRWRAGHTLGRLDEVLDSMGTGVLRTEDTSPIDHGELPKPPVYVEVFFDPPRHRRLPINDDELIERALAIQAESGKVVTFLTFDTAQSTRAKFAGLAVTKLTEDPGPEPVEG